jgi:hypothetical protein
MEITEEQYARIEDRLPVQRGNVSLTNLQFLSEVLYAAEHGRKWRGTAEAVWQLAHHLYAHESLVEKRDFGPDI